MAARQPPGPFIALASLRVSVRWPQRATAGIPLATDRIEVEAYMDDQAPVRAVVVRPPYPAFTTAVLEPLRPGTVRVSAIARDAAGKVLATGSSVVTLRPNELGQASVRLDLPAVQPVIDEVIPRNAFPGSWATLSGKGFGFATGASYSVVVGGVSLGADQLSRPSDQLVSFLVPPGASAGAPVLRVGNQTATASMVFSPIATVSLSPARVVLEPGEHFKLTFEARDAAGALIPDPTVIWTRPYMACSGCEDGDVAWVDADGTVKVEDDLYSGEMIVQLGIPPVAATATIQVVPD